MSKLCLLMRADDRGAILTETVTAFLPASDPSTFEIVVVERGCHNANISHHRNLRVVRQPQLGFDQPIAAMPHGGSAEIISLDAYRDYHPSDQIDHLEGQIAETLA